tara:strand:- start:4930 stop:5193 length:264 start_codon:yes stop_codon:yes gene_type:complete
MPNKKTKATKAKRTILKNNKRNTTKRYVPGVDGPKITNNAMPGMGVLGKATKTKEIVKAVNKVHATLSNNKTVKKAVTAGKRQYGGV